MGSAMIHMSVRILKLEVTAVSLNVVSPRYTPQESPGAW
jgi:hypothetical protein